MGVERDVARGIYRLEVARARGSLAGFLGCSGTCVMLGLLAVAIGLGAGGIVVAFLVALVVGAWCYNRIFTRTMNR